MKKKNIIKFSIFMATAIFSLSCQDVSDDLIARKDYDQDMVALTNMGFSKSKVKDIGDSYLIDGCLAVNKKELVGTRQAYTGFIVKNSGNIKVFVQSEVPDVWKKGTTQAIAEFNKLTGTSLRFSEVARESEANLVVRYGYSSDIPNSVIAWAESPSSTGLVGRYVNVNSKFVAFKPSESIAKYNMAHEIGHAVGFRHTNLVDMGEGGGIHVTGTAKTDNASVFNGNTAGNSWAGFSSNDIMAIRTLYPAIADNSVGVIFYEHSNYGGASTALIPKGRHDLAALQKYGFKNDWASSFIVKGNVKVTIYEHDNFTGWWAWATQSVNDFGSYNDGASSVVVE